MNVATVHAVVSQQPLQCAKHDGSFHMEITMGLGTSSSLGTVVVSW